MLNKILIYKGQLAMFYSWCIVVDYDYLKILLLPVYLDELPGRSRQQHLAIFKSIGDSGSRRIGFVWKVSDESQRQWCPCHMDIDMLFHVVVAYPSSSEFLDP